MEHESSRYATALGDQLRNVRAQQGLSLQDVEQRSDGVLKASVVGAYERGERSVSVARLRVLADFYHVPITQLLQRNEQAGGIGGDRPRRGLRLDLTRLQAMPRLEHQLVQRFLGSIQVRRGDFNGRVITIRHEDLETLGAILDIPMDELRRRLMPAAAEGQHGESSDGNPSADTSSVVDLDAPSQSMAGPASWMPQG
jgi:transcriptional regulator with XRE-family HTH domain